LCRSPPRLPLLPYTTLFRSSLYRRHDAHAARDHHAIRAAPGHRRVPSAGHGGAIGSPPPGGADRPALPAGRVAGVLRPASGTVVDRKSTRLNSSHEWISYAV